MQKSAVLSMHAQLGGLVYRVHEPLLTDPLLAHPLSAVMGVVGFLVAEGAVALVCITFALSLLLASVPFELQLD